ncbi:MAG: hypothetical protein ACFFCK_10360, partial [Promethearchaeota archaeon]
MDHNWTEMIQLYKQEAESYLNQKKVRESAGAYQNLGYAHAQLAETAETAAENVDHYRSASRA